MSDLKAPDPRPRTITGPRLGRIHDRVLHVLAEVDAGAPADKALSNTFRRARDLGSSERASVSEEVYGLLRHRRRARDILHRHMRALKKPPELFAPPILLRLELLTHLALDGADLDALRNRDPFAAKRIPKLMERVLGGKLGKTKRSEEEEDAIRYSLPTWMWRRLRDGVGPEVASATAEALLNRAPVCLRVDESRMSREALLERLANEQVPAHPTAFSPWGVVLEQRVDIRSWPELLDARVDVQDEGSQLVVAALAAQPGETILDACAGAGGKSLALWSAMRGEGELMAVEPDAKKLDVLRRRLDAAGAKKSVKVEAKALEELPESFRGSFDAILVDAPCTGTGTLRRHPDLKWRLDEAEIATEASRQARLLGSALSLLKPGGRLVYATCSVLREENEAVVEELSRSAPELDPVPLAETWGLELAKTLGAKGAMHRIGPGPGSDGPDGFFVASFRKQG